MKNTIQLTINTPCTQKFESFQKTTKGGFCKSCTKEVIDFRNQSDTQIASYFKNHQKQTCGYFKTQQLKKYNAPKKLSQSKKSYLASAIVLSLVSFLSNQTIMAQEINPKAFIKTLQNQTPIIIKKTIKTQTLHGTVYSNTNHTPIPGVSIVKKNSVIGTDTDFDGNFELQNIQEGYIISCYSLGFKSQDIVIKKNQTALKIIMEEDSMLLGDVVIVGAVNVKSTYKTKRSFWQRIKTIF